MKKAVNILKGLEGCMVKFESEKKSEKSYYYIIKNKQNTHWEVSNIYFVHLLYVCNDWQEGIGGKLAGMKPPLRIYGPGN